jgi:5'-deoxynucleotidase YfbR-like HD superfamily hydrolase
MSIENCAFTNSGKYVNLVDPDPATINISDIAKALSQQNRFAGHTRVNYYVAQHCLVVSSILPLKFAMHGLMHDCEEAYFGDLINPVKRLPEFWVAYQKYAEPMRTKLFEIFGIEASYDEEARAAVDHADRVALATERRDFVCPDHQQWAVLDGIQPLSQRIRPISSIRAESEFLTRFKQLTGTF